ncbi:MAG: hypothetical protein R3225_02665 [Halofilum sp. (in: g-proteobacteria)]|nr:hypothetical protein [Halofilum sp. (in: g-proteobacteria)]
MRSGIGALILALALTGCASLQRALDPGRIDAHETLDFMVRLHTADSAELAAIGAGLQGVAGPRAALRRALWQSVPGHPGAAPAVARRQLESLLADGVALGDDARLLLRVQLQHLDERARLAGRNADLAARNRQLQEQIEALTALERAMGEDGDNAQ